MYKKILFMLHVLIISINTSAAVSYQTGSYNYAGWIYSTNNSTNYSYGSIEAFFHIEPQAMLPGDIKYAQHVVPFGTESAQLSFSKVEISERNQAGFNGSLSFHNPYAAGLGSELNWVTRNNPSISVDFILDRATQITLERNINLNVSGLTQSLQSNISLQNKNTSELISQNILTEDFLINVILPPGSYSFNTSISVETLSGEYDINSAIGSSNFSVSFIAIPLPTALVMFLSGLSLLFSCVKFR